MSHPTSGHDYSEQTNRESKSEYHLRRKQALDKLPHRTESNLDKMGRLMKKSKKALLKSLKS